MPVDISPVITALTNELRAEQQRLTKQIRLIKKLATRVDGTRGAMKPSSPRRRRWSKAARAAVSRRMRAYWASRRRRAKGGARTKAKGGAKKR